jgi:uncharacterized membrane protein
MNRAQQPALTLFAAGMMGLGVLALIYGDFALVWQPVAPWVLWRTALAYGSGVLMLLIGAGLLFRVTAAWAVRVLFPYLIVWVLLKAPALVAAPQIEGVWLGVGELTVLLAGGWTLFATRGEIPQTPKFAWLAWSAGERGVRIARIVFAASLLPIGLSHLMYTKETAALVPAWLPDRSFWALLTGAGQMACGVGVLVRLWPRVAATAEAVMLSLFALLVWAPAIVAAPATRLPWTAFFISWAITAAAWVVAANIPAKKSSIRTGA